MDKKPLNPAPKPKDDPRAARLKLALKANLQRRKTQAKARANDIKNK